MEIWKPVVGYETFYEVSNLGRVMRLDKIITAKSRWGGFRKFFVKGKILKGSNYGNNYRFIMLCKNGTTKAEMIHRIVATAFIPNIGNKPQVNHIDGNKQNNRVDNLEWVTRSENMIHAAQIGLVKNKGGENPYARSVTLVKDGHSLYFETQREAANHISAKEVTLAAYRKLGKKIKGYEIL